MKKQSVFLFCLRSFFYFSVTGLILLHPGILVSYDRIGYILWFVIIPLETLIAFLPPPKGKFRNKCILAVIPLLVFSLYAGGFSIIALQLIFAGALSFCLTFLLFYHPRWAKLSLLEPFFLAFVLLRLLAFSRSGEDAAGQSMAITQFIFIWTAVVFLLHSVTVYFCIYPRSRGGAKGGAKKEGIIFAIAAAAALLIVLAVLPDDFVKNSVITNLRENRMPEKVNPSDSDSVLEKKAENRKKSRRTIPVDKKKNQSGSLRGISENNWPNNNRNKGDGGGEGRQYTVMVVASKYEPVYMGSSFLGQLDPDEGFLPTPDEPLNRIPFQRFFVTWTDNERIFDRGRRRQEVFSLSTLSEKYLPYRPAAIDPTIISENTGPLRYLHRIFSNAHTNDPLELVHTPVRNFSAAEKNRLSHYLDLPLYEDDIKLLNNYLNNALKNWQDNREELIRNDDYLDSIFRKTTDINKINNEYLEIILAILISFNEYQYSLNPSSGISIDEIKDFLFSAKDGACVEFSNSLALLGRLAGIPSRIVTGYLAAEGMQTPAHLRGLAALYNQLPVLRQFSFEDLYLVTNAHRHSWTQFYIPEYGWLDFEATSFAIPPEGMGDIGNWDVVIPLINDSKVFSSARKFPWKAVMRAIGFIAALLLLGAYILRFGREIFLYIGTRQGGRRGARSLYLLLLARLAADGKPIKPASKTAMEFSQLFPKQNGGQPAPGDEQPPFAAFAALYTELRWREFKEEAERDSRFLMLRQEYQKILKVTRRRGIAGFVIRIFSLKGLAYL